MQRGRVEANVCKQGERPLLYPSRGLHSLCIRRPVLLQQKKAQSRIYNHSLHAFASAKLPGLACSQRHAVHRPARQAPAGAALREHSREKSCLSGGPLQGLRRPRVSILARLEREKCVVTATLVEEGQLTETPLERSIESILARELEEHPDLVRGTLENGLEYVILPNSTPPQRFEAHLEMHVGSVDEQEDQQGIAHIVEHVTFLGSKKREQLLGTGARSNAYTDFHHTVFHVHSPLTNTNALDQAPMLPQVLDTLAEVAFRPELLTTRLEKERKAVLAEAQMMNTIEYRVDCYLLKYLHQENALGSRFPIGKTEQVEKWDRPDLLKFWQKWYFPANATLYLVGDFGRSVEECKALIQQHFGGIPAVREGAPLQPHDAYNRNGNTAMNGKGSNGSSPVGPLRQRHQMRPPVEHLFGCGSQLSGEHPARVEVFQHRLLQHFMLSIFCKLPVQPIKIVADLRRSVMVRIILSVLSFRINRRYVAADPPFIGIELDISDSSREGCAVSTLTITSEPKDWRGAVQVAVQEVRRLQKYGVTQSEMERYSMALLRDAEQAAEQASCIPSVEMLDHSMESIGLDHTIMDQRQTHRMLEDWADTITVEEVNKEAASLLAFAAYHGNEEEVLAEAQQNPDRFAAPGPTRSTAVVACFPAFTDPSGESLGGAAPMQRGASMTTDKHVDPAIAPKVIEEEKEADLTDADVPEGAVRFELSAAEIDEAIAEASTEVEAPDDVDVPASLLSQEDLERLTAERNPHYVPLEGAPEGSSAQPPPDPATGVVQRRLSNGMHVNYWKTENEPRAAMIRVVAAGGRAGEGVGPGPSGSGAVAVGTRTISESGTVGPWRRDQVELFCVSRLLNCILETDEEFVYMDCHFAVGNGGLQAMLELLHNFLEMPRWEEGAMERAKQMFLSHYKSLSKSLERATADRILAAMFGPGRRFRDAGPEEIEALTLDGLRQALEAQLHAGNIEVNIVGDFDPEELEDMVVKYLGTVAPAKNPPPRLEPPVEIHFPAAEQRRQTWHLKDSDERATAYIAGKAPPQWGNFDWTELPKSAVSQLVLPPVMPSFSATIEERQHAAVVRQAHPLYSNVTLRLLVEIMNGRLFTTVRDTLGLTYDVSFELSLFDRLRISWFVIHVTSTPAKIRDALAASLDVLRSFHDQPVAARELLRAKRTLLTRHDSDLKDNAYRLSLITHLQRDEVPLKTVSGIRDLAGMYETATIEDIYNAYNRLLLDDDHIFTCIGTSGPKPLPAEAAQPTIQNGPLEDGSQQQKQQNGVLAALLAAVQASQQSSKVAEAMVQLKEQKAKDHS